MNRCVVELKISDWQMSAWTYRVKACPHCRRKVRLSPNSANPVAVVSLFSATVALFCDSVDRALEGLWYYKTEAASLCGVLFVWRFNGPILEGATLSKVQTANVESFLRHRADYRSANWRLQIAQPRTGRLDQTISRLFLKCKIIIDCLTVECFLFSVN